MTQGIRSHGTKLSIGDGVSPEGFTLITERFAIPPIGGRGDLIDMSNHDSVAFMEYLPKSLEDGNELTIECNEIPGDTAQDLVRTARANKTTDNWQVEYVDGTTETFPAIVLGLETDPGELDGRVVFRFFLKIVGAITRVTV